jgi:RNA-binding protein
MSLSPAQRREYRAIAHHLKPVVTLGDKGLSEGVREELERALNDHELIKVKVAGGEKEARTEQVEALCEATGAELVQIIGRIAVILRRAKKPNPKLSNLSRVNG